MKLIANNFTGFLSNGKKYRIDVRSSNGFVTANLMVENEGVFWVDDIAQNIYSDGFVTYKEALRKSLTALETKHGIKLIKAELEVA